MLQTARMAATIGPNDVDANLAAALEPPLPATKASSAAAP
jgi:hypothetical protein